MPASSKKNTIPADQQASVLFSENYNAAGHIIINQGGTSSGKTYAIEQVLFCLANSIAYQMINNFPPVYVDVKDVNNQQNILAQTINRVNL